jgi:hypothetical protein
MKEAIYKRIGITDDMDAKTRDAKVKEYQGGKKIKADGIIGPQMLENLENEIGDNIAQGDSNAGDVGDFNPYADDAFQEADKRMTIEETEAQETEKEEKMSKFYTEHGDTDFDVALLEEAGIDEVEYSIYKKGKKKEKEWEEQPIKKDRVEDISTIQLTDGTEKKLEDQTWQEVNGKNYFRAWEELIRVDENGTFNQYTENKDWKKVDFKDLPPALQEKAGKNKLEELMKNPEFADKKIGELDDKVGWKGTEAIMEWFLASQPRPEWKSKIGELTLSQLKQFQEKPESFASSNLIPKDGTAIDPNEYGIKSEWKYAEDSVWNKIKIPVKGDITMDTIMVTDVADNKEKSQKKWLEWLVNDTSIEAGRDYVVAGSPNLMLRKEWDRMIIFPAGGGDIQAEYKKGSGGEYAWAGETVEAGTLAQNN